MTVDAEYSRPRIHRGSFLLVRKKEINKNKRTVESGDGGVDLCISLMINSFSLVNLPVFIPSVQP